MSRSRGSGEIALATGVRFRPSVVRCGYDSSLTSPRSLIRSGPGPWLIRLSLRIRQECRAYPRLASNRSVAVSSAWRRAGRGRRTRWAAAAAGVRRPTGTGGWRWSGVPGHLARACWPPPSTSNGSTPPDSTRRLSMSRQPSMKPPTTLIPSPNRRLKLTPKAFTKPGAVQGATYRTNTDTDRTPSGSVSDPPDRGCDL